MNDEIVYVDAESFMETTAYERRMMYDANHVHSGSGKCLKWRYGLSEDCPEATQ